MIYIKDYKSNVSSNFTEENDVFGKLDLITQVK